MGRHSSGWRPLAATGSALSLIHLMEKPEDNTAPAAIEQGAAQPEATGTPPAKSVADTKLENQLADAKTKGEGYKKERDAARKDLTVVTKERDAARTDLSTALGTITAQGEEIAKLKQAKATPAPDTQPAAEQKPSEEESIKELLRRNGLPTAWVLPDGTTCFQESHARHVAGEGFDSLTSISAE
jgi:hypothetical protein